MYNRQEVLELAGKYASVVRAELGDAEIYLFGSYARGDAGEYSDIDIAVISDVFDRHVVNNRVRLLRMNKVSADIEPHPVMLEDWENLTPLTHEIKRDGVLICI